jgi:geranylgeranyl pyrophosphate synthase
MRLEDIEALVLGLPEVATWPEMADTFEQVVSRPFVTWELPLLACRAVGAEASAAIPGAAAIACMQLGLLLVDDMLDKDPRGVYRQLGQATTANLAFAFQAAAFRVIEHSLVEAERRTDVYASLAQMALTTAFGQNLDTQNLKDEESYWKTVRAKTAPCFGVATHIGALLGLASLEVAERLRDFGLLFGEVIQVYDDLLDALRLPPGPDWTQGRNNLAILYARTADHPERARFETLLLQVTDPQTFEIARQILIHCGAGSYCAYHVIRRYQAARQLLDNTPLVDAQPLLDLLARQRRPLVMLLEDAGARIPPELEED